LVVSVINAEISVILHNESKWCSSLVPGVGSPGGFAVSVIKNEVSVVLHNKLERSLANSSGVTGPDSVLFSEVSSTVNNEIAVVLHSGYVKFVFRGNIVVLLKGIFAM